MVSILNRFYNFRAYDFSEDEIVKLKIANLSIMLAVSISTFYSFIYLVYFNSVIAALVNQFFAFAYLYYFSLIKKDELLKSRLFFFTIFLIHMLVIVIFFTSNKSGFHFYYILSVPGAFLFFSKTQEQIKYGIPSLALLFFILCHISADSFSSFQLNNSLYEFMFMTTIISVFIILGIVMTAFQDELRKKEERLEQLSTIDSLTEIYNRRAFYTHADTMLKYSKRYKTSLGVVIFDIDFFKSINDVHGHDIGDIVLKKVSKELSSDIRETDCFARYGGEEFILLLPEVSSEEIESFSNKFRLLIENLKIETPEESISITASFGVSLFKEDDTIESLIKRADIAMYEAKRTGRNRVCSFF